MCAIIVEILLYLVILRNPPGMDLQLANVRNEEYIHLVFANSRVQQLCSNRLCTFQDPNEKQQAKLIDRISTERLTTNHSKGMKIKIRTCYS